MSKSLKIWVFLIGVAFTSTLVAQNSNDAKLAAQYYNNKEYDKAQVYYEKLFNATKSEPYYVRLLDCFIKLEAYKSGEKLIKRQLKKNAHQLYLYTDLGNLYDVSNQSAKSKQAYEKALKLLTAKQQQIMGLANGYLKYQQLDYAISTYQKGQKLLKGSYPFNFELAQVYYTQGKTEEMLNEYLALLDYQESYIQSIQNALQTTLVAEDKALLKSLLIRRVQKNGAKKVFSEMLIWVYIQEKNFAGAFIQAKALDKRENEDGKRIMSLGSLSVGNKDYETAIKCYEYITEKGDESYYYSTAKMAIVEVYNKKIIDSDYTQEDLLELASAYQTTIDELGKTAETVALMNGLAHLNAFYLHDTEAAKLLLNETIGIPRIKPYDKAKSKLGLADILLFTNDIWEASLLYSQVEKAYKHDQLGENAKFKNAQISFYTGDFSWAKTQLDALKASTSKLIANDAMRLSILITDNIEIDTTTAPLMLFAQADLLAYQNKNEAAMNLLDTLKLGYPNHTIADDILYKRYQINYKQKKYTAAAKNLEAIVKDYAYDILADDAIYYLALLYDNELGEKEKAANYYKKIIFDYQDSIYVVDARKRYRALRDELKLDEKLEFESN